MNMAEHKHIEGQSYQRQEMPTTGYLTGETAHGVRNQLTVIDGFARMLLDRSLVKDEGR